MSNIVRFPERPSIRVIEGISRKTGEPIYLLEYVEGQGSMIVEECFSVVELQRATGEWEADGVPVIPRLAGGPHA